MTLAAQAQYQKVKADAAKALGDQQLKDLDQKQRHELAMRQLQEKTLYDQQKLDVERDKIHAQHVSSLGQMAADIFKTAHEGGVDIHTQHLQNESDQAVAAAKARADAAKAAQGGVE